MAVMTLICYDIFKPVNRSLSLLAVFEAACTVGPTEARSEGSVPVPLRFILTLNRKRRRQEIPASHPFAQTAKGWGTPQLGNASKIKTCEMGGHPPTNSLLCIVVS